MSSTGEPIRHAPLRVAALAVWALGVLVVAFVLRGGVALADQALLHVLIAVGAGVAASLPGRVLSTAGAVRSWALGAVLVMGTLAVGLVPIPAAALAVVSPGILEARPADAWHTLSFDAEATVSELGTAALVLGYAFVVGIWGAVRRRRHLVERAILYGLAAVATAGLAHRALSLHSVFGIVETSGERGVLYGPLVNGNHMGTLVLLGLPVAAAQLFEHEARRDVQWAVSGYGLVAGLALAVVIGSPGVLAAGLVVVVLAYLASRGKPWHAWAGAIGGLVVSVGAVLALLVHETFFLSESVAPRGLQWRATGQMLSEHWLAGVGGGSYGAALPPYRLDGVYRTLSHTHSDPLEWLAETGLIGLLGGLAILRCWWPAAADRDPGRAQAVELGVIAVAVHAWVDFPLQIPAVAMAVLAVLVARTTVYVPRREVPAWLLRGALVVVVIGQLPLAWWQWRGSRVDAAYEAARAAPGPASLAAADEAFAAWAPWRADAAVVRAWRAESAGDVDAALEAANAVLAAHPEDAAALRQAALVFARARRYSEAEAALERAAERAPRDQRTWVALARVRAALGRPDDAALAYDEALSCARPGENVDLEEAYRTKPDPAYWVRALADSRADWSAGLGLFLLRRGHPEVAVEAFRQAGRNDPVYLDDLRLADALMASGRGAEAEEWLRARTLRHPDDPEGWVALGKVLTQLGRHDEAVQAYVVAIDFRPTDVEARLLGVRGVESDQGVAEALKWVRRFEATGHRDPALSLEAARLLHAGGDSAACLQEIETRGLREREPVAVEAQALFLACGGLP